MKQTLFFILVLLIGALSLSNNVLAQAVSERSKSIVTLGGQRYYIHTVVKGDTFYHLGKLYDVTEDQIRKDNLHLVDGLKLGQVLKISFEPGSSDVAASQPQGKIDTVNPTKANSRNSSNQRRPNPAALFPSNNRSLTQSTDWQAISSGENETIHESDLQYRNARDVKSFDRLAPINVAIMLPLKVGSTSNHQYLEFYQGALLALNELKSMGISVDVNLYNTARSASVVEDIVRDGSLSKADLIIGPVYDNCFSIVADYAARKGIPLVSPLAEIESSDNSLLFQVSPSASMKNDKLREDLADDKNVIVFSTANNDADMVREITPLLPHSARHVTYSKAVSATAIDNMLSGSKENVFVVLASDENSVDEILARISSVQNNLVARSIKNPLIKVIGNSRWARFPNIEKNLFFKLNVRYITSYHADRSDPRVAAFDSQYVSEFGTLPTLYSYRGYDVAKLFVSSIKAHGSDFDAHINSPTVPLLQTRYLFAQSGSGRKFENRSWAKVCYNNDYTIVVK